MNATSVPLANIQDEWSDFDLKDNDKTSQINKTINRTKEESLNLKSNEKSIKALNCGSNCKSNCKSNCGSNCKSNCESNCKSNCESNCGSRSPNCESVTKASSADEEVDDEFSAFEQQFKVDQDNQDDQPKLKVESLEELVSTFDEKIVNCFINYEDPVGVPVQFLNHEELINECQMWWRLTSNFNQILPIDWRKTHAMKYLLPYLIGSETTASAKDKTSISLDNSLDDSLKDDHLTSYDYSTFNLDTLDSLDMHLESTYSSPFSKSLNRTKKSRSKRFSSYLNEFEDEDEERLANDLDFHSSLIFCSNTEPDDLNNSSTDNKNSFTAEGLAEEVLKELDIILQDDYLDNNLSNLDIEDQLDSHLDNHLDNLDNLDTLQYANNSNYYTCYLQENDELDFEIAKEITKESVNTNQNSFTNSFKLNKLNGGLLKPYANSIGTSFSSNSLDELISSGSIGQLTRSQTSSSVEANSVYYPLPTKNQTELEQEKQLFEKQLRTLSVNQLNEISLDLERMINNHSEILISELNMKDELEYEKELKNQFISLLICIQNKRRKQNLNKKSNSKATQSNETLPVNKYLTTIIPFNPSLGPPDTKTLQILIKILKAMNEGSPTLPNLLTDFILKVLCPT